MKTNHTHVLSINNIFGVALLSLGLPALLGSAADLAPTPPGKPNVVIFMSDNGASVEDCSINRDNHPSGFPKGYHYGAFGGGGNSGIWRGAKATYYEGGIRVPAIISYPSILPKGVVRDQAISSNCTTIGSMM